MVSEFQPNEKVFGESLRRLLEEPGIESEVDVRMEPGFEDSSLSGSDVNSMVNPKSNYKPVLSADSDLYLGVGNTIVQFAEIVYRGVLSVFKGCSKAVKDVHEKDYFNNRH